MKITKFYILIITAYLLTSCSKDVSDDVLSGQMLMGPFTTLGMSGVVMNQQLDGVLELADAELMDAYKSIFATPYNSINASQTTQILLNEYRATDKNTTEAAIKKLFTKAEASDFKAYEYACAVNVANLAFASGYFTQTDVSINEQNVLKQAKLNYSDWENYLEDFLEGRESNLKEDPNDSQQLFEIVVNEVLLKHEQSPFLKLGFPKA